MEMKPTTTNTGKTWLNRQIWASLDPVILRFQGADEELSLPGVKRLMQSIRGQAAGFLRRCCIEHRRIPSKGPGYWYSRSGILRVLIARRDALFDRDPGADDGE